MLAGETQPDARPVHARVTAAATPALRVPRRRIASVEWIGFATIVALGITGWVVLQPSSDRPAAALLPPAGPGPLSEAQTLIAKISAVVDQEADASREDWNLAESMGAQAVKLEPGNAEAWAAYADAATGLYEFYIDRAGSPLTDALTRARKAVSLAPDSDRSKFVLANCYRFRRDTQNEAETMLREFMRRRPENSRALRSLASVVRENASPRGDGANLEEALRLYQRAAALPGDDPAARREMAAVLGLSESHVGVKLNRIKNQLTQTLKGNENEPQ